MAKKPKGPPTPKTPKPKQGANLTSFGIPFKQLIQGIPNIDPKKVVDEASLQQYLFDNFKIDQDMYDDFLTDPNGTGAARLQAYVADPANMKTPGAAQPQNVAGAGDGTDVLKGKPFKPSSPGVHGRLVKNLGAGGVLEPGMRDKVVVIEEPGKRTTTYSRKKKKDEQQATGGSQAGGGQSGGSGQGGGQGGGGSQGGGSGNPPPSPKTLPPLMDEIRAARQSYIDAGSVPPFYAGAGPIVKRYGPATAAIVGATGGLGALGVGIGYGLSGGKPPQQAAPVLPPDEARRLLDAKRGRMSVEPTPQVPPSNPAGTPAANNTTLMQLQRLMQSREYA